MVLLSTHLPTLELPQVRIVLRDTGGCSSRPISSGRALSCVSGRRASAGGLEGTPPPPASGTNAVLGECPEKQAPGWDGREPPKAPATQSNLRCLAPRGPQGPPTGMSTKDPRGHSGGAKGGRRHPSSARPPLPSATPSANHSRLGGEPHPSGHR